MIHGQELIDPYRWLEDQNSPETRGWINAQNEYTQSLLSTLPGRGDLKARLTELIKVDRVDIQQARNGRYFFTKQLAGQELPALYMRKSPTGSDELLIDPLPLSPDHTISVSLLDVSKDGTLLAYGLRQGGEDETTVNLLDVDTRKDLVDRLPKGRYVGISIKPDKTGFYYARYGGGGPRVYYHAIGTAPERDVELFGKRYGPGEIIGVQLSESGRYLLIIVSFGSAADKTEVYYQDLAGHGPITPIVKDIRARFFGHIAGDHLYMQTNWEAPNGRIIDVDLNNPARQRWREVVPASEAPITGFSLAGGKLLLNYLQNVIPRVKVFEPSGRLAREVTFPVIGSISSIHGRWESNEVFFTFGSFNVPPTIYRYDVAAGQQEVWYRVRVPLDSDRFEVKQVWYASKDGTRVPMFIVHAKGIKLDGSSPALLTGYGGFLANVTPSFSSLATLWIERGGVYAVANLRGGGEFGEAWHRAGMLGKKQNVFDDFIAAAEWLVKNGYTNSSKLAIRGGSNGGLLVGAALTQRPDLFGAVICTYPLLDMVRYHRFLVAKFWVPEYGSSEDPEQFRYLYAYSPYHQVKAGTKYPAVLFVTGDSDTRVDPLHARKMTARLQATTASGKPILLHYDTKAGHTSGGTPASKQIDDLTDELSFLFWQLRVSPPLKG